MQLSWLSNLQRPLPTLHMIYVYFLFVTFITRIFVGGNSLFIRMLVYFISKRGGQRGVVKDHTFIYFYPSLRFLIYGCFLFHRQLQVFPALYSHQQKYSLCSEIPLEQKPGWNSLGNCSIPVSTVHRYDNQFGEPKLRFLPCIAE